MISGAPGSRQLRLYMNGQQRMGTTAIDDTWSGGAVGLYRGNSASTSTLQWDNFKCGYDVNADGSLGSGDYIYANYDFNDAGGVTWQTLTLAHDDNGNLTDDGLFKYSYDAWNRLAGTWYHDAHVDGNGHPDVTGERVATYAYDGLFRRIGKVVANQGEGVVFHSDDNGTGIQAGDRTEHYFYSGWRLVEQRNGSDQVLGQFVYGTQYIDEPAR